MMDTYMLFHFLEVRSTEYFLLLQLLMMMVVVVVVVVILVLVIQRKLLSYIIYLYFLLLHNDLDSLGSMQEEVCQQIIGKYLDQCNGSKNRVRYYKSYFSIIIRTIMIMILG